MTFSKAKITKDYVEEIYDLVVIIHDKIIATSGGTRGVRDKGGLYNSIYKILLNIERSQDPVYIGAFIYKELARRHHFNDGNKRTSHILAKVIIFRMNRHLKIKYKDALEFIIEVARYQSPVTVHQIESWVKRNLESIPNMYNIFPENYLKSIMLEVKDGTE